MAGASTSSQAGPCPHPAARLSHCSAHSGGVDDLPVLQSDESFITRFIRAHLLKKRRSSRQVRNKPEAERDHLFLEINGQPPHDEAQEKDAKGKYADSPAGRMAKSKAFEYTTIAVIILNALFIGWDTDYSARFDKDDNLYKGPAHFAVLECIFCAYFTAELLIRFIAYRVKWHFLWDAWFVFDGILVLMMVIETLILPFTNGGGPLGGLNILRLLRLLRIARMAKLMRAFPQLLMIVKGIMAAMSAVIWTLFLLVIVTYTWAIIFTNQYHQGDATDSTTLEWAEAEDLENPNQYGSDFFGSMGKSMLSLLIMGTILDDVTACTDVIRRTGNIWMLLAFIIYILFNSFTMMNMLVGILVEVVGSTAESENNRLVEEGVREAIMTIFMRMDKDKNGSISREEFSKMKRDRKVMKALHELDVKEKEFDMYVDLLFQPDEDGNSPHLSFSTLLDCICRLRPGTAVNALDFASFKQSILKSHSQIRDRVQSIEELCSNLPEYPCGAGDPDCEQRISGTSSGREETTSAPETAAPAGWKPPAPSVSGAQKHSHARVLEDLGEISSEDIINELQRRLGVGNSEGTQGQAKATEAFRALSAPEPDPEWSREILTC